MIKELQSTIIYPLKRAYNVHQFSFDIIITIHLTAIITLPQAFDNTLIPNFQSYRKLENEMLIM